MKRFLVLLVLGLVGLDARAQSYVPSLISYSGRVVDATGTGISATRTVTFRIWKSPTSTLAADRIYSEQQTVILSGGEFSVQLGAGSAVSGETNQATFIEAFSGTPRYLGITVDDGTSAADPEMSPRQQILASVYAQRARVAESLAPGSVVAASIATAAVATAQLADAAVSSTKLGTSAVLTANLSDGSVTTTKLADGSVTSAKLAGGIDASKIADASLTLAKHAANSVDGSKLVDGSITLQDMAPNSVDGSKILDGSIGNADHADGVLTGSKLASGTVTGTQIASATIAGANLQVATITSDKLAAGAVTTTNVADAAVTRSKLSSEVQSALPKGSVVYGQLSRNTYMPSMYGARDNRISKFGNWTLLPIDLGIRPDATASNPRGVNLYNYEYRGITVDQFTRYYVEGHAVQTIYQLNAESDGQRESTSWGAYPAIIQGLTTTNTNGRWYWRAGVTDFTEWYMGGDNTNSEYGKFYCGYPGTLYGGTVASVWKTNIPQMGNGNSGGPPQTAPIVAMTALGTKGYGRLEYGHTIYVGEKLRFQGLTAPAGAPDLNAASTVTIFTTTYPATAPTADAKEVTVTAVPDRYSFEFTLPASANTGVTLHTYTGTGNNGAATMTHFPKENINRVWFACQTSHYPRLIVTYK